MTTALVLAAGASTRMGRPKQLLPWGGKTLLREVVDRLLATSLDEVIVVLGCRATEVRQSLLPSFRVPVSPRRPVPASLFTVVNPHHESGMLSSVQCGLRAMKGAVASFAIALGDQPGLPPDIVEELLITQRKKLGSIVIPRDEASGKRGHPVVFDGQFARAILALEPQQTLRDLVDRSRERIVYVSVATAEWFEDVDTPEDYARIRERPG